MAFAGVICTREENEKLEMRNEEQRNEKVEIFYNLIRQP